MLKLKKWLLSLLAMAVIAVPVMAGNERRENGKWKYCERNQRRSEPRCAEPNPNLDHSRCECLDLKPGSRSRAASWRCADGSSPARPTSGGSPGGCSDPRASRRSTQERRSGPSVQGGRCQSDALRIYQVHGGA